VQRGQPLLIAENLKLASRPFRNVSSLAALRDYCTEANFSAVCFASAFTLALTEPALLSLTFCWYLGFLGLGYTYAPKRISWSPVKAIVGLIVISALVAVPVSMLVDRSFPATAFGASLTVMLFFLMFIKNGQRIFYCLIPVWLGQAALMTWEWFYTEAPRVGGLAHNVNAGSAFLLLGALFVIHHPRLKWLAIPLLVPILFSGSRWTVVVAVTVFGLIFLARHIPWRYLLVGVLAAFIFVGLAQYDSIASSFLTGRGTNDNTGTLVKQNGQDIAWRLSPGEPPTIGNVFIPMGFTDSQLHSVPFRMAVETGVLSGVAWLLVGGIALYRRPRCGFDWAMLLAIGLLSIMYYHTWIGPMGLFWWLLVGHLDRPKTPADA